MASSSCGVGGTSFTASPKSSAKSSSPLRNCCSGSLCNSSKVSQSYGSGALAARGSGLSSASRWKSTNTRYCTRVRPVRARMVSRRGRTLTRLAFSPRVRGSLSAMFFPTSPATRKTPCGRPQVVWQCRGLRRHVRLLRSVFELVVPWMDERGLRVWLSHG